MDVRVGPWRRLSIKELMFWTVVLKKTLESPLESKAIKLVNPKGNQPWIFIGRSDAIAEAPILWPPDVKSQLIGKDLDAGKDWGQKQKVRERIRWLDSITDSMDMNLSKLQEIVEEEEAWHAAVHGVTKSRTWLRDWTTTTTGHWRHFVTWQVITDTYTHLKYLSGFAGITHTEG